MKISFNWSLFSKEFCLNLANYSGLLYSTIAILGVSLICLLHICPTLYGEENCHISYMNAGIILTEILINLILFTLFNPKNHITYWTVKSSSLLIEDSEKIAQIGKHLTDDEVIKRLSPNKQHLIMDSRSSESLQKPPAAYERLDYRDPLLGKYEDEILEISNPKDTPTTKYCSSCNIITPRRCHHCPLCNICILRKDHHCFLTGGCVGLANQRFFIVFLFWATIGSLYGSKFLFAYLNEYVYPWFPFGWLTYVGPISVVRWALGYESAFNMMIAVLFSMAFSSGFGALAFFIFQMFYTLEGYTMHDYHVGRLKDHLESDGENWSERLALVFGKRWYLNFIFPMFWTPNHMTPQIAKNIFLSISKDL